eukprot:maker-scaffold_5-snap-gene-15.5-mRNA-1 protein AED:0.00 eAED:0.00 QI:54/1/1/1/0/0/2/154/269
MKEEVGKILEQLKDEARSALEKGLPEKILHLTKLAAKPEFQDTHSFEESGLPTMQEVMNFKLNLSELFKPAKEDKSEEKDEVKPSSPKKRKRGATNSTQKKVDDAKKQELKERVTNFCVPCTPDYVKIQTQVKKECKEILKLLSALKVNIQLSIPKFQDGNNFGVQVQEEIISEVGKVEESLVLVLEQDTKYFSTRGMLVSKLLGGEHGDGAVIEDYRKAIYECDDLWGVKMKNSVLEVRNHLLVLLDMFSKNKEKLEKPRGAAEYSMY